MPTEDPKVEDLSTQFLSDAEKARLNEDRRQIRKAFGITGYVPSWGDLQGEDVEPT